MNLKLTELITRPDVRHEKRGDLFGTTVRWEWGGESYGSSAPIFSLAWFYPEKGEERQVLFCSNESIMPGEQEAYS